MTKISPGKAFEYDFIGSLPIPRGNLRPMFVNRYKDGTANWNNLPCPRCGLIPPKVTRFQHYNIADFEIYDSKYRALYILELKSHAGKSIPYNAIRKSQYDGLQGAFPVPGVYPAMVFNMRDVNETYIIHIHRVLAHKNACTRKSFPIEWMREVGFRIHSFKKVSRYTYEIMPFFEATGKRLLAGFEKPL